VGNAAARHQRRFDDVCSMSALPLGSGPTQAIAAGRKWAMRRHYAVQQTNAYSITSSARAISVGGTVRPSAMAVFRLITNSNLDVCTTGKSAGE